MATQNRDLSTLRATFVSQIESAAYVTTPAYRSPSNKTAYVKKITITNNTSSSGTFDVGVYDTSYNSNGNLFIVPAASTTTVAYSTNGFSWSTSTLPSTASWQDVAYGNGRYVMVSYGSTTGAISTDGITWSTSTLPSASNWISIAYGNGIFVTVSRTSGSTAAYSTDGVTWSTSSIVGWPNNGQKIVFGNGRFVAIANSTSTAYYSTDAITWTSTNVIYTANTSMAFGNGLFVISNNTSNPVYSTDAITWNYSYWPSTSVQTWKDITFGNGTFVAIQQGATYATYAASSSDGITWTYRSISSASNYYWIQYGNGQFVAGQYNAQPIATSTDGITWTSGSLPSSSTWINCGYPRKSDFTSDSYLYKSVSLASNTTQSIPIEIMLPAMQEIRVRSTVPMQVTINGEV